MLFGDMSVFKVDKDIKPFSWIMLFSLIDFAVYFLCDSILLFLAYYAVGILLKCLVSAWNHHHQHSFMFKKDIFNRLFEVFLGLQTGCSTHLWVLHHVLGHHPHYLDQNKDESGWKKKNGETMSMLEYTFVITATSYYRAFKVGNKYPKRQKEFVFWGLITFGILAALIFFRPMAGFFVFALPMLTTLTLTSWTTYDHHAGLDTEDPYKATYNIMNPLYNKLSGNLGYHTAHHLKPGVHWSKLPELHSTIEDKIPEELFVKSTFDFLLPIKEKPSKTAHSL